jgi:tRNA threonylcarbamoyl adenosine modification protein YjeE
MAEVTVALDDLAATGRLAARLAGVAERGDVIALAGPLGAGKTAFARAFVAALAEAEGRAADEVPSPTFTLVQSYDFERIAVYHFDLYRIADPNEAWELGLQESLVEGVTLIEWPERLGPLLPTDRLDLALAQGATTSARIATLTAHGERGARLLDAVRDG